jgi:hypothetical protein
MTRSRGGKLAALTAAAVLPAVAAASASAAPRAGDYEAHGSRGAVGSFAVVSERHEQAIEDLVVQAPIGCSNAFSTPLPIDVEVLNGPAKLGPKGTFELGAIPKGKSGTLVSGSFKGGAFSITYRHVSYTYNAYEHGTQVCDTGRIHLTARAGHRKTLKTGIWEGQTAQSEPVEMNVVAGGRALVSPTGLGPGGTKFYAFQIASSSASDSCAYKIDYPVFLNSNGTFSNADTRLGDEAVLSAAFGALTHVSGQFSNLAESCPPESWSASWYLATP